jgi:hypothetical protein
VTQAGAESEEPEVARVPILVWVLVAIFALRAVVTLVGSFVFAFPMGGFLGIFVGLSLVAIAVAYGVIAWRMRFGERWVWIAAIVAPLVNQLLLTVTDLSLYGAIPPEDYPFIVITVVVLVLLFLPPVRRFFTR